MLPVLRDECMTRVVPKDQLAASASGTVGPEEAMCSAGCVLAEASFYNGSMLLQA